MAESYLPMLLFLGLLTAFTLFMLWAGYKHAGVDWMVGESGESAPLERACTGWFEPLAPATNGNSAAVTVNRLEQHLRAESRMAARFVEQPTIEHLHESTNPVVDQLVRDLEAYLHDASAAASSFAESPSVCGLHGASELVPVRRTGARRERT